MKTQSSIDWLYEQFMTQNTSDFVELYLIAKEKHKHEIESAWKDGLTVNELNSKLATDYYNKTFDHD
jgi:hypothetical protein